MFSGYAYGYFSCGTAVPTMVPTYHGKAWAAHVIPYYFTQVHSTPCWGVFASIIIGSALQYCRVPFGISGVQLWHSCILDDNLSSRTQNTCQPYLEQTRRINLSASPKFIVVDQNFKYLKTAVCTHLESVHFVGSVYDWRDDCTQSPCQSRLNFTKFYSCTVSLKINRFLCWYLFWRWSAYLLYSY